MSEMLFLSRRPTDLSMPRELESALKHLVSETHKVLPLNFSLSHLWFQHGYQQPIPGRLERFSEDPVNAQALLDIFIGLRVYTDSRRSGVQLLATEIKMLEAVESEATKHIDRDHGLLQLQRPNIGPPSDKMAEALFDALTVFWVAFGLPLKEYFTFKWIKSIFLLCRASRESRIQILDRRAAIAYGYPPEWAPELRNEIMQGSVIAKEEK